MPDTLKFTDDEINEIRFLQNKFQDKLIKFGQIQLEIIELEDRLTALKNEQLRLKNDYLSLQKTEQELMDKLTNKYGEGSLNLKEGTFTPSK
jgi:predicted transcriptional regulator